MIVTNRYSDQSLSPAARFYQSLVRQQNGTPDQNQQSQKNDFFGARNNFGNTGISGIQDSGLRNNFSQRLGDSSGVGIDNRDFGFRKALNSSSASKSIFSSSDTRSESSNPYGLGRYDQSTADGSSPPDPNDYVAQFKQLLNPQTPATAAIPAPNSFGNTVSAGDNSDLSAGFGVVTIPTQVKTFNSQWSNPALIRNTVPTVGATAYGQSGYNPLQPSPVPDRMQPQIFTMPKRWF